MKVRTDFVTNSSSSSFILTRKGVLSELQKQAIIAYVESKFLGCKLLHPGNTEEEIREAFEKYYISEEKQACIRDALKNGHSVYWGDIVFEECDEELSDIYKKIWNLLKRNDTDNFDTIDDDLSY